MICKMCGTPYDPLHKQTGQPKKRPICGARRCHNMLTYRAKLEEYRAKKLAQYYENMAKRPEHVRNINRKAKAKQRYGIVDRKTFLIERKNVCENCGKIGKRLIIHHIDNRGRKAELLGQVENNNPTNLMVICDSCHIGHHRWGHKLKMKT